MLHTLLKHILSVAFTRFFLIGLANTTLFYICFLFFVYVNVYYLLASALSYLLAALFSYFANKIWAFNSTRASSPFLFLQFLSINTISLGINLAALFLLSSVLGINIYLSQAAAIFVSMIFNYIGYNWLFRY